MRRRLLPAVVVALGLAVSGCQGSSPSAGSGTSAATVSTSAQPTPSTSHLQLASASSSGVVLPNQRLTPGLAVPTVTKAVVCASGYSSKVQDVPESRRKAVFAAYKIPYSQHAKYELDHLISLELGGSNSAKNLWPEPLAGTYGAKVKDKIEDKLHELVCSGQISLAKAQKVISTNWWTAYKAYVDVKVKPTRSAAPTKTAAPTHVAVPTTTAAPTTTAEPTTKAVNLCGAPANPYGYNFCGGTPVSNPASDVCSYFNCIASFWDGHGYMAECNDGTFSMSGGVQGACSRHGGEMRAVDQKA